MKKILFIASILFLASCGDKATSDKGNNNATDVAAHATDSASAKTDKPTTATGTTSTPTTGRYAAGDNLNVFAVSGLTLRDKPDIKGAKVAAVPYGASATVLAEDLFKNPFQATEMKGLDIKGNWVKVKVNGKEGYLFDGFLLKMAAPQEDDINAYFSKLSKKVNCSTKAPKKEENLFHYEACSYENGINFVSKGYEGGGSTVIFIPSNVASFEEAYLIAKAIDGPQTNLCKYDAAKGIVECTDKEAMQFLSVTKKANGTEVELSVAD